MIKNFVKILELLGDRLEVCVSVCRKLWRQGFSWQSPNNVEWALLSSSAHLTLFGL